MKLSNLSFSNLVAVIGDQGTGKTRLLGTLAQLVPTVIVTADTEGLISLRNQGIPEANLEIIQLDDWRNIWSIYNDLERYCKQGIKAITIDDLGKVQGVTTEKVSYQPRGQREERMNPEQRREEISRSLMLGERRFLQQQWGEAYIALDNFLKAFRTLPCDFKWLTVLQELQDDPRTGEPILMPDLAGSLRAELLSYYSMVVTTFKAFDDKGVPLYCASTRDHPRVPTKDRYSIPRTWIDPTAAKLLRHLAGKDDQGSDTETPQERSIGVGI